MNMKVKITVLIKVWSRKNLTFQRLSDQIIAKKNFEQLEQEKFGLCEYKNQNKTRVSIKETTNMLSIQTGKQITVH